MTGKVIAIAQQKGGVGKSTLAVNLSAFLARYGRTLLVDADSQGTALSWAEERTANGLESPPFAIMGMASPILHKEMPKFVQDYDFVVIDSPPKHEKVVRSAVAAADLVLVPVPPSGPDFWAARYTVDIIEEVATSRDISAIMVINMLDSRTRLGKEIDGEVAKLGIPLATTQIRRLEQFKLAMTVGKTIGEWGRYCDATLDMDKLGAEILSLVGHATAEVA